MPAAHLRSRLCRCSVAGELVAVVILLVGQVI
jgi:hypothetical protein